MCRGGGDADWDESGAGAPAVDAGERPDGLATDVVVTLGCGDACPLLPEKRYRDRDIVAPDDLPIKRVREIHEVLRGRVHQLLSEVGLARRLTQIQAGTHRDCITGNPHPNRCAARLSFGSQAPAERDIVLRNDIAQDLRRHHLRHGAGRTVKKLPRSRTQRERVGGEVSPDLMV